MLEKLPVELIEFICDGLRTKSDILTLCLVSKQLYNICIAILYKELIVCFSPESNLAEAEIPQSLLDTEQARQRLRHVRHLHFVANFHERLFLRCISVEEHGTPKSSLDSAWPKDYEVSGLWPLAEQALQLLECIPHSSLLSFSWELGMCTPFSVCRHLRQKQPQIENLSIIASSRCENESRERRYKFGTELTHLKDLSCLGITGTSGFRAVGELLELNANWIERFALDAIKWPDIQWREPDEVIDSYPIEAKDPNGFLLMPWIVFGIRISQRRILYPSLKHLSFTAVGLAQCTVAMAWAFNFLRLERLTLIGCAGTVNMLAMLSRIDTPFRLKRLELVGDPNHSPDDIDWYFGVEYIETHLSYIARFLRRLPCLEDLFFLIVQEESNVHLLWRSLLIHQSECLRRLVLHRTEPWDRKRGSLHDREASRGTEVGGWTKEAASVLSMPSLTSLGLREMPERLQRFFGSIRPRPSITFFHLRNSARVLQDIDFEHSVYNAVGHYDYCEHFEYYDSMDSETFANSAEWEINPDPPSNMVDKERGSPLTGTSNSPQGQFNIGGKHFRNADLMNAFPDIRLDELRLIQWMFGDKGFPQLRIIALGDFGQAERYDKSCRFFARAGNPASLFTMEEISRHDSLYSDLILDNMDMLRSCPTQRLFWKDEKLSLATPPPPSSKRHYPGRM